MRPEPPSGEQNDARTAAGARPQRPPESSPTRLSPSDRVLAGRVLGVKTSESGCFPVWPASVFMREAEVPGTVSPTWAPSLASSRQAVTVAVVMSSQVCGIWQTPLSHCMGIFKKKKMRLVEKTQAERPLEIFPRRGEFAESYLLADGTALASCLGPAIVMLGFPPRHPAWQGTSRGCREFLCAGPECACVCSSAG